MSFKLSQTFCPGVRAWARGLPDSKASFMTHFSTRRAACHWHVTRLSVYAEAGVYNTKQCSLGTMYEEYLVVFCLTRERR
jgi:hypothetical protein